MSVALITGASSGIGMEFARQLAQSHEVDEFWLIARRKERMEALADELSIPCRIIVADLASEEGIDTLKATMETEKPSVKWLICAAGFGLFGDYSQVPEKQVMGMIDVNVKALVRVTYMTIPYMPAGGHILEMGSGSCFTPLPNFNVYASSKAFVLHFSKALRFEVKKKQLSVTAFCPGWVDTEFIGLAQPEGVNGPKSMKPLLKVEPIVKKAIRACKRGRVMCVTNWYTKMQHVLFKILPDSILTRLWLNMLRDV